MDSWFSSLEFSENNAEHLKYCWCNHIRIAHPHRYITWFTYTFESADHRRLSSHKTQENLFADRCPQALLKRSLAFAVAVAAVGKCTRFTALGNVSREDTNRITTLRLSSQKYKRKRNNESWCATRRDCEATVSAFNVPLFFSLSFSLPFHSIVTTLSF